MTAVTSAAGRGVRGAESEQQIASAFALRRGDYVRVVLAGLAQAACLIAFVLLLRDVLAAFRPNAVGVVAEGDYQDALVRTGLMAVTAVLLGIFRSWEFSVAETAGYEVVRRLRMVMYAHLQRMLPGHLRHRARGGLLLRMTGDLSMLRMWLSRGVLEGISAVMVLVAGVGVVAWFSVWLALALVAAYACGAAISLTNGHAMRAATRSMRRRRSLLIGNVDEQLAALPVSQVFGRTAGEYSRLSRQNDSLTRALVRVAVLRGRLRGIASATSLLASTAVLAVGLVEVHRSSVSIEAVIAASLVTRLLSRPVRTLGLMHDYWHRGLVSRQKVIDFLRSSARPAEQDGLEPLRVRRGEVEFIGAGVQGQFEGLNATLRPRQITCLTGPPGSGAEAVLQVLCRQVDLTSGVAVVDGQVLDETRPSSIARHVGVISPSLPLLRGSMLRNLTYGERDASPEEVQRVFRGLGLDELCERMGPEGIRTWLTEGGGNLEPSDRQLLALGRALVGNPTILLLEDPLALLSEEHVPLAREMILRHRGTVVWVTQNPNDLELADEVWVFDGGVLTDVVDGHAWRDRRWLSGQGGELWRVRSTI